VIFASFSSFRSSGPDPDLMSESTTVLNQIVEPVFFRDFSVVVLTSPPDF